ncbi:MAG: DinB family protein [Bryobacteraceae bacterium]
MAECPKLREHLVNLLNGGSAHLDFKTAVSDFRAHLRGMKPAGAPHSAWELIEHLRIAQQDILEFSRNPKHVSPKWPEGYWPETESPPNEQAWDESLRRFQADLQAMQSLVGDESNDLFAPIAHEDGQTLLREALVIADHNSYHIGQLVMVRRMLEAGGEAGR